MTMAIAVRIPSGWRQPNEPPTTSSWKAATMHAAASATPTATGASSTPGSGIRSEQRAPVVEHDEEAEADRQPGRRAPPR